MLPLLVVPLVVSAAFRAQAPTAAPAAPAVQTVVVDNQSAESPETIAEIVVHGNNLTPDTEVIRLAGVSVGSPFGPTTLVDITTRLRAAKRFDSVDVLKRLASIADPSKIAVVIIVSDGPVRVEAPLTPGGPVRIVKRHGLTNVLFLPILDAEDGYGLTYGAEFAYAGFGGKANRLSLPLTWGGTKRAAAEFDRDVSHGPISRIEAGVAISRQQNPAFQEDDDRRRVWARVERRFGPLRLGGGLAWDHVVFAELHDEFRSSDVDATFDTRVDPALPRNAVYATAHWTRLDFSSGGTTIRTGFDGRGYLGLIGQTVLVARVVGEESSRPLPPYLQPLLGGWSNLRGFQAGAFVGDTLLAGSLELRVPLTSALNVGRLGVSVFVDTGTAYDVGEEFAVRDLHTGVGAGVWMTAAAFHVGVSVAHGHDADTRVNFGLGLSF